MNRFYFILFLASLLTPNYLKGSDSTNVYLKEAIFKGINEMVKLDKHSYLDKRVYVVKIISIGNHRGEFSISYIHNDYEYEMVKPSHFILISNKVVLIRTDSLSKKFTAISKLTPITTNIKNLIFDKLAGPNNMVTGQPSDVLVVHYRRRNIKTMLYSGISNFLEKKYSFYNDER